MPQDLDQYWSTYYDQGRDFSLATSQAITKFLQYVDPQAPKTCLDIGCGSGQLTRELYHRGYQVLGVDASASAIKLAELSTEVADDQLEYLRFDIEQDDLALLPQPSYGLITCKLVYAFIKDKLAFLKIVHGLLVENGTFVIITPLIEDVPPEKANIAVTQPDIKLLGEVFNEVKAYKLDGLAHFIGRK